MKVQEEPTCSRYDILEQSLTCDRKKPDDVRLVLVKKQYALPDDWTDRIELDTVSNEIEGDEREFQVEKVMLEHFNALRDDRSFLFLCLLPLICIVLQAVSLWERECREDWQSPGSERIWPIPVSGK